MNAIANNFPAEVGRNSLGEAHFHAAAPAMVRMGWSVYPQERTGRMPGKLHGRTIKWIEEHNLAITPPTPEFLRDCVLQNATLNVAGVFGPASGNTFAVDIDILDRSMAEAVTGIAHEHLGPTPFMRVGRQPKIALIYRHGAKDIVRSSMNRFAAEEGHEMEHALEIQGVGKSLTFHGRHHQTGNHFLWVGDANPMVNPPSDAPEVSSDQVQDFLHAVNARFPFSSTNRFRSVEWKPGEAKEGVSVPRLAREPGAPRLTDGREDFLRELVWRACKAHGAELAEADEADARALVLAVSQAVVQAFGEDAETTGKWAPGPLRKHVGGRVESLAAKYRSGRIKPGRSGGAPGKPGAEWERPTIKIVVGDTAATVDAAQSALIASGQQVYQRGGTIVRLGEVPLVTACGKEISSQRVFEVGDHALQEALCNAAKFARFDTKKVCFVPCDPPMWIAKHLQERKGALALPVLTGVVSAPTMRADGSLLTEPGYDPTTGLLLDTRTVEFLAISENPTREQAEAALAQLSKLIETFPFVSEVDRSVALACLLTAVVRRSLRTAPMFGFSAPVPGSGKSTLVDLASILMSGREAPVLAPGRDPAEDEKRLGSVLLGGDPILALDNCESAIGSVLLNQILTQPTVRIRILGRSQAPELPTGALVTATGQNLVFYGDMGRRALLCRLDPGCENPEQLEFKTNPIAEAKKDRGKLVSAALTVLRAYHVAGSPAQTKPLGSFLEWSRLVRDALAWLGCADPVGSIDAIRALDPKLEAMNSLFEQWKIVMGGGKTTARELIEAATKNHPIEGESRVRWVHPDFREALLQVAGDGGFLNSKRLGKWMTAHADRIVGGAQIVREGTSGGTAVWRLAFDEETLIQEANPLSNVMAIPKDWSTPLSPDGRIRRPLTRKDRDILARNGGSAV